MRKELHVDLSFTNKVNESKGVFWVKLSFSLPLSFSLMQTHDPGWPEELHILAAGQRRSHGIRSVRLRHVQSPSQATVISYMQQATAILYPAEKLFLSFHPAQSFSFKRKLVVSWWIAIFYIFEPTRNHFLLFQSFELNLCSYIKCLVCQPWLNATGRRQTGFKRHYFFSSDQY